MRLPTASSLWLAALCPASHVLPQTRLTSPEMERGTAVHRYLERLPQVGRARALEDVPPEHRELCELIDPAQVPQGAREVALAWNVDTGEVLMLGEGIGRDYTAALRRALEERDEQGHARGVGLADSAGAAEPHAALPGDAHQAGETEKAAGQLAHRRSGEVSGSAGMGGRWIFGTADVVEGLLLSRRGPYPVVSDYKVTDVPIDARGLVKPAGQSHQLRFLALAVARWTGGDQVDVAHLRVQSDGRIDGRDRAELGYFDLAQIESEVRDIVAGVERAAGQQWFEVTVGEGGRVSAPRLVKNNLDLHPGEHCRFCPAAHRCPSTQTLIRSIDAAADPDGPGEPSDPAEAWLWLRRARVALDLLEQELRQRAALVPIRLPDGSEVREVDVEQRSLDPRVAHDVMRDAYGRGKAWEAMETSRAALQRAIGGGGAGLRSVLKEIEARGGVQLTTVRRVVEVAPEPGERPAALVAAWPEDMDPEDFTALHVGPARSER